MKIGIIAAIEEEISLFKEMFGETTTKVMAQRTFHEVEFKGHSIVFVLAQIGKVAATITTTMLISEYHVDCVIFTGVAGAIDSKLNVGDIVISDKLIQHDLDASPVFPRYEIPLLGIKYISASDSLVDFLSRAAETFLKKDFLSVDKTKLEEIGFSAPKIHIGTIVTGDQFVKDHHVSAEIQKNIDNPVCVEMEGAAVAQACYSFKTPCVVIRVISDKANCSSKNDFLNFLKIAGVFSKGIISEFFNLLPQNFTFPRPQ